MAQTALSEDEIAAMLHDYDWAQTPLGAIATWSDDLKAAVQIQLSATSNPVAQEPSASVALRQIAQTDAFRIQLSDALRSVSDAVEVQAIAARTLGESLGATRVIYIEIISNEEVIVERNYTNGVAAMNGRYRFNDFHRDLDTDHQAGRTQVVTDVPSTHYSEAEKAKYREIEVAAHIDVPLIKQGQFVALLAVHQSTPRQWTEAEIQQVEETAERTWEAVERARAEAALRDSEAKYRTLFESIDEGYFIADVIFDADDRPVDVLYLEANPAVKRITGLDVEGRSLRQIDPNYEFHWWEAYGQVVQTGIAERRELYAQPLDSWFSLYIFRIGDANSRRIGCVFQDVTERKRTEADLRESEELKQRILESSKDCIKVLTLEGQITYINTGGLCLLELDDPAPVLNACWVDFWRDQYHEQAKAAIAAAKAGNSGQFQGFLPTYRGTPKWWDCIVTPVRNSAGQITQLVVTSRDITEQKQAEAERERLLAQEQVAREQAETANRIKDEFLAVLSHELRSPLNPILGWTKLLLQKNFDATRTKAALTTIERNAQLQAQLIDDLLDISRILRGKLSLNQMSVDLRSVVADALETVRLAAEAKSIQVETRIPSDIGAVLGDAGRLQQVVWNLLSNAVKFTPQHGRIAIALLQTATHVQIQVQDTGKGIAPNFLPYVFEHFRQEDGAITRKFGGLGLGLAIARQIVELHGGTIAVESPGEDQGTTFIVQLPLSSTANPLPTVAASATSLEDLSNIPILVVDDELDSREIVAFVLEQAGAIVTRVASGQEALNALEQFMPSVIVSDIGMPEMDGYHFLKQVRGLEQIQHIPAIALTAYASEFDRQQAEQAGFQLHLSKPIDPNELIQAIANLIATAVI